MVFTALWEGHIFTDYLFTQTWCKPTQIIATEDERDSKAPGALIAALTMFT